LTKEQAVAYAVIAMKKVGFNAGQRATVVDEMIDEMDDFKEAHESALIYKPRTTTSSEPTP